ncbi:LOW QUALITY PROTEIN: hypothetical protein V2J09_023509 [Rumex salicifolius]
MNFCEMLQILGLESCSNTIVGNPMKTGISGGQKKRLTTGEILVGQASVLLMDGISNGLDTSTTFQVVNSIRNHIHILKGTAVISLLQPEPETYDLFDDIILLSDKHIVYHGPCKHVLEFFGSMGFKCPPRKGVADFLQEVTSRKDQHLYWTRRNEAYHFITAKEFADAFRSFYVGYQLSEELRNPFDKMKNHPNALSRSKYGDNTKDVLKACIFREFLLIKKNSFVYVFKLFQLFVLGLMSIPVFYENRKNKDSLDDGTIFMASMFFTVSRIAMNQFPDITLTISKLPIFYKQRDLSFYPVWAYALPSLVVKMPLQFVLLLMVSDMCSALFRFLGAAARNLVAGNVLGLFSVTSIFLFGGFTVSREDIKKWFEWIYWVAPTMYAQNGMAVNEFLGDSWNHFLPNATELLGVQVLKSRGLFPQSYWYWISLAALLGFTVLFNTLYAWALYFFSSPENAQSFIPEDVDGDEQQQQQNAESLMKHERQRRMVLPIEKHFITFDEISYSIDLPKEMIRQGVGENNRLEILKGVSGIFRPGVLTALMGVSGAGKTTLLDVLAGRKTRGFIQGDIRVSGYPKNQQHFARISGYCEQNDIHSPNITVYESLLFSAWLRLSSEINSKTKEMFIQEVMEVLELTPLRDSLVGLPGVSGLSLEQRKRLTVAVELVANPSIIFMDEPTSGLDARSAATVMRTVKSTVDTGRTVVCTIHQPSIDIFESFDELFLMKQGGQEIYVGPLGINSCHLINYFEGIQGVSRINEGQNPASWMLEVTKPEKEASLGVDFAELYRSSNLFMRNKILIQETNTTKANNKECDVSSKYSQSYKTQFAACLWKQHWSYWRYPQYTTLRLLFTAVLALLLGSVFWDLNSNIRTKQVLFSAVGSMYATAMFLNIQNCLIVQPVTTVDRTVYYREKAAGMYSALPYALAQALIEVPYVIIQTALFSFIVYPMMGFEWNAAKILWYLFIQFFGFLYCTYLGMMIVALTPTLHMAAISSSYLFSIWSLFAGFLVPRMRIPIWWRWNYWICPFAWSLYALTISQFGDDKRKLDEGLTVEEFIREYFGYHSEMLGLITAGVVDIHTHVNEFDIENLDFTQKKMLLDKLVGSDNENLLLKIKQRIERQILLFDRVGLQFPTVEVRFEHLQVGADVNVGSRALPTVINFIPNIIKLSILENAHGIIKPGRMTLLLGPPRSGKTTLLKALAGKLDPNLKVTGKVTYNGHCMHEFVPEKTVAFRNDFHLAELTVRETLAFSARCLGVGNQYEMLAELLRREKAVNIEPDPDVDIFMKSYNTQIAACLWKQHCSYWRNPQYNTLTLLFTVLLALLLGSVFWDLNSNIRTKQVLFNAVGSMYSTSMFLNLQNCLIVQPVTAVERTVFYREKATGMYSALPYALAQALIEVPYVIIQTVLFSFIVYPMMGFEWKAAKFGWYLFIQFFSFLYCTYFGMMIVALTPTLHVATIASSYFHSMWGLFAGFLVPMGKIPLWWRWNYWICPFAWSLYALTVSQFGDDKKMLDEGLTVEEFIREHFGYNRDLLGLIAAGVVGFTFIYLSIYAVAIKMINFQSR